MDDHGEPPQPSAAHAELGLTFWWDVKKLWDVDLPIVTMPIAQLEWLLDIPFWDKGSQEMALSGRDLAARPELYRAEYKRTMAADLTCPINVIRLKGRWTIMDGLHRLLKAYLLGHGTIPAKQAHPQDIPLFSREWWEPHNHPAPET